MKNMDAKRIKEGKTIEDELPDNLQQTYGKFKKEELITTQNRVKNKLKGFMKMGMFQIKSKKKDIDLNKLLIQ